MRAFRQAREMTRGAWDFHAKPPRVDRFETVMAFLAIACLVTAVIGIEVRSFVVFWAGGPTAVSALAVGGWSWISRPLGVRPWEGPPQPPGRR